MSKELFFRFAHLETKVEFSPIFLQQDLPGKVHKLAYNECTAGCPMHEEKLREIVQDRFKYEDDDEDKTFEVCFRQYLFRKRYSHSDVSVKEVTDSILSWSVKQNSRHQYLRTTTRF